MKHPVLTAALLGAACLLSACVTTTPTAGYPPVPPLQPETIPAPPVTSTPLIWQPGHWNYAGNTYVWQPGAYIPQGSHSNMFMPGYWAQTAGGWAWQPAHWM
jgi:hypothetical protein